MQRIGNDLVIYRRFFLAGGSRFTPAAEVNHLKTIHLLEFLTAPASRACWLPRAGARLQP